MSARRALRVGVALSCLACCGEREGALELTVGGEADALSRPPAPTVLVVERVGEDRRGEEIARAPLPTGSLDLGERNRNEVIGIRVSGLDASGARVVAGETVPLQLGALEGRSLPVFVQRVGELARMPGPLPLALPAPRARVVVGRFVFLASEKQSALYDLLTLAPVQSPSLSRPARSVVAISGTLLVIDEAGATTIDLTTGATSEIPAPSGGAWSDVAGGTTVTARDGTHYVIGATRSVGAPSTKVLRVDREGVTTFASLVTPRLGACAAFVDGRGLVVAAGSATGAGAEVLAPSAPVATALPFPPDATAGCAAATTGPTEVIVVGGGGGEGPPRALDLACGAGCAPSPWPGAVALRDASAVVFDDGSAVVAGDAPSGETRVFRLRRDAPPAPITVRAPRSGARLLALPTGAAALVGGALEIEQITP